MRGSEFTRRFSVSRLLLGAALGIFGFLLLGAAGKASAAWASDETPEATDLATVADPLVAEVSDTSRLAARLVPQNQQGHRATANEGAATGLVSGLTEPVGSLVTETDETVHTALRGDARTGLLDIDDESVGDSTAEVVTPLVGTLVKGTASIAETPAPVVSGVYETVATSTDQVDVLARLVTDGLGAGGETTPGSVHAGGQGQPSFTTLLADPGSTEAVAALERVSSGRPAAALECSAAADGLRETDRSGSEIAQGKPGANTEKPWSYDGPDLPDLKIIPGGATGSTAGISVDSGHSAVNVSPNTAGEQVSFARTVIEELGRPMDRAAEQSVAPD